MGAAPAQDTELRRGSGAGGPLADGTAQSTCGPPTSHVACSAALRPAGLRFLVWNSVGRALSLAWGAPRVAPRSTPSAHPHSRPTLPSPPWGLRSELGRRLTAAGNVDGRNG